METKKKELEELQKVISELTRRIGKKPYKEMAKAIQLINTIAWEQGVGPNVWDTFNMLMEPPNTQEILEVKDFYKEVAANYGLDKELGMVAELEERKIGGLLPKKGLVLDAGCGIGRYSVIMAKKGCKVIGVDISPEMLSIAKKKSKGLDVDFKVGNIMSLKFGDNTFDHTICTLVLNDITNWKKAVKEIVRVTKPGGSILISTIHPAQFGSDKVHLLPFSKTGRREVWTKQYVVWFSEMLDETRCKLDKYLEISDKKVSDAWGVDILPILQIAKFIK